MNKTSHYELTIIVPVYNEEDNISVLEQRLSVFLPDARRSACVLFVNDGSSDSSLERIVEMCKRHTAFFYLSLEHNGGLSAALKAGIDATQSPYVGYMDADLQTAPEDFNLLLAYIDDHELVDAVVLVNTYLHHRLAVRERLFAQVVFAAQIVHDGLRQLPLVFYD